MERYATLEHPSTAYDDDVVAWADAQVALLRDGRLGEIDLFNIIEEIEGVSGSQRTALASQTGRIVEHLLKLIYSPAIDPRRGWIESIEDARQQIDFALSMSPSLRGELEAVNATVGIKTARNVARTLKLYGELPRDREQDLLGHRFAVNQVIGDWLPPNINIGR